MLLEELEKVLAEIRTQDLCVYVDVQIGYAVVIEVAQETDVVYVKPEDNAAYFTVNGEGQEDFKVEL